MTEFVVYDLEYTAWQGSRERKWSGPGEYREIVQIGAVRLDRNFNELASLDVVVRPRINPQLSDYLIALTGISQDRVDTEGRDIADALACLVAFAAPDLMLLANGTDGQVIVENCQLAGLPEPFAGRTRNINSVLVAACGDPDLMSADLPRLFGLDTGGRGHDALADARNVAAALAKLVAEGRFDLDSIGPAAQALRAGS